MPRITSIAVLLVLALLSVAAPAAALDGIAAQPKELWEEFPLDSDKSPPPPAEGEQSPQAEGEQPAPAEPEGNQAAPAEPEAEPEPAPAEPQRAAEQSDDGGLPVALLVLGGLGVIALLVIGRLMLSGRKRRRRAAAEPASPPAAKERGEQPPAKPERRPKPAPATVKADKPAPVAAAQKQPAPAKRDKPAVKADKPAPIVAQKPAAPKVENQPTVAAQKPAPATEQKPAPAREPRPAPASKPTPAPVVETKPAPVAEDRPTRIAAEPPAPAKEPKPAPVVAQKPAPPKEHRPAVGPQDKPTRVGTQRPTPVADSKPTPVAESKPTRLAESKPTPVAEAKTAPPKEQRPAQTPATPLSPPSAPPEPAQPRRSKKLPDDVIPFPTRPGRIGQHSAQSAGPQRALGYVSATSADAPASDLETQTEQIRAACVRNGFESVEVVRDFESHSGSDLERPGLIYAIERLEAGEAGCLVVASLERLTRSAAHLGTLIDRLGESRIRLVVLDIQLDTGNPDGRLAAEALANVGTLERKSLDTRTRKGLQAAREARQSSGRPAVADRPALKDRIADMRARGMTLQAIADTLNAEGVPTLRGGAEWRPSSVQAAVGYKRPKRGARKSGNGSSPASSKGEPVAGDNG